ncbi:MAG: hypothetical protein LBI82_02755 [Dysgonamonadaceae bacterium]|jgi:hypothetical protein|nr:hypothetical protein [Dysgonamonadaceae bacterium]
MKKIAILLSLAVLFAVSCAKSGLETTQQVSNVSATPYKQDVLKNSGVSDKSDKVNVEFTNKGVQITHYNFEVPCDFTTVNVTHTFVDGVLSITQQGYPNQANCVCHSDVSYTIEGILQNEVNVIFINGEQIYCYNDNAVAIDTEINIRMVEVFDKSSRTLQMYFSTTKIYPCCNYPIALSWQKTSNSIEISFKSVIKTDLCLTAPGPATATIDLGALSNGTYQLNLQNEEVRYSGELVVTSENYSVNFVANPAFNFTNSRLNKIPEHTIWGLVGYHKEETLPLVQSFFTALMELGATKKSFTPGYYTGFEIDKNGDIAYPGALWGYWFDQPFIFHYSGNTSDLDEFLKQWSFEHSERMNVTINTDKGERFLSWMYK